MPDLHCLVSLSPKQLLRYVSFPHCPQFVWFCCRKRRAEWIIRPRAAPILAERVALINQMLIVEPRHLHPNLTINTTRIKIHRLLTLVNQRNNNSNNTVNKRGCLYSFLNVVFHRKCDVKDTLKDSVRGHGSSSRKIYPVCSVTSQISRIQGMSCMARGEN